MFGDTYLHKGLLTPHNKTASILNCPAVFLALTNELFLFMSPLASIGCEGQGSSYSLLRTELGSISDHCFLIFGYTREVFRILF